MNFGSLMDLAGPLAGGLINPTSGLGMAGGPMSGLGMIGTDGNPFDKNKSLISDMQADERKKKEGIASMFSGLGKGMKDDNMRVRLPEQQPFDVQGLLASLFGG